MPSFIPSSAGNLSHIVEETVSIEATHPPEEDTAYFNLLADGNMDITADGTLYLRSLDVLRLNARILELISNEGVQVNAFSVFFGTTTEDITLAPFRDLIFGGAGGYILTAPGGARARVTLSDAHALVITPL